MLFRLSGFRFAFQFFFLFIFSSFFFLPFYFKIKFNCPFSRGFEILKVGFFSYLELIGSMVFLRGRLRFLNPFLRWRSIRGRRFSIICLETTQARLKVIIMLFLGCGLTDEKTREMG